MSQHPALSLQLYSLRRETAQDAEATLRQVADAGYDGVELAGDYGWDAEKWQRILADTGLAVVGAHVGLEKLEAEFSTHADFLKNIGGTRLIVPSLPGDLQTSADTYGEAARRIDTLARQARDAGLAFFYHNHAFEFVELEGGGCGMDILLQRTDTDLVRFEFDTYWLERGGRDSRQYIDDHAGRTGMIHAKELRKSDGADVPAGQGDIDFPPILAMAKKYDWPVVVEFEGEDALDSVRQSATHLRGLL